MASKIADLRKPLTCILCTEGMRANHAFLFDPHTSALLKRVHGVTFGAYRHHVHHRPDYKHSNLTCAHFFEVYQVTQRGFLTIIETHHMADLSDAVALALYLDSFPTEQDLKLNGL